MVEIDLLDALPKAKRPLEERAQANEEDRKAHWRLGREYFDGTRAQGLGGYYYDGRWKPVARRLAAHYGLDARSAVLDIGCAKGFLLHDFLEEPDARVADKTFNAGYQNMRMIDIAERVKSVVAEKRPNGSSIAINTVPTDDIRSYRINCDKIRNELGFVPRHTIENAAEDLVAAFSGGLVPDPLTSTDYINIKRMQEIGLK